MPRSLDAWVPLAALGSVLLLVAVRRIGPVRVKIWQAMAGGAAVVLLGGQITPERALGAVNFDVLLFLFGMFVVGEALRRSGYLAHLAYHLFNRARSVDALVVYVLVLLGGLSAVVMNDTIAVIGTPLVLLFAVRHGISPRLLLLALCHGVTIGSLASPLGNPQNLLIAMADRMGNPFLAFARYLLPPAIIGLGISYTTLRIAYRSEFHATPLSHEPEDISDPPLARLARLALWIIGGLVLVKVVLFAAGLQGAPGLVWIALFAAAPILAFSPRRLRVLAGVDWSTILFFAAMFVLMQSVWDSPLLQSWLPVLPRGHDLAGMALAGGLAASQVVSNVPLVALALPLFAAQQADPAAYAALAAGSTLAGNALLLGAASNVIVIQAAEKLGETIGFLEFARVGIPSTAVTALVFWAWFKLAG